MHAYFFGRFAVIVAAEYVLAAITLAIALEWYGFDVNTRAASAAQKYANHFGDGLNFLVTLFIGIAIQKNFAVLSALKDSNGALRNLETFLNTKIAKEYNEKTHVIGSVKDAYRYIVNMAIETPQLLRTDWETKLFNVLDRSFEDIKTAYQKSNIEIDDALTGMWTDYTSALVDLHATRMHFLPENYTPLLFTVITFYYGIIYPTANCAEHGWSVLFDLLFASLFNNILYAVGMAWAKPFVNDNSSLSRQYLLRSSEKHASAPSVVTGARVPYTLNFRQ